MLDVTEEKYNLYVFWFFLACSEFSQRSCEECLKNVSVRFLTYFLTESLVGVFSSLDMKSDCWGWFDCLVGVLFLIVNLVKLPLVRGSLLFK